MVLKLLKKDGIKTLASHVVTPVDLKRREFDPENPLAYTNLMSRPTEKGSFLMANGLFDKALPFLFEGYQNSSDCWAPMYMGDFAYQVEEIPAANVFYSRSLERSPDDWLCRSFVLANLGGVRFKLGDFEGGVSALEEAIFRDATNDRAYGMLAVHKAYTNDWSGAEEYISRGLGNNPESRDLQRLRLDFLDAQE